MGKSSMNCGFSMSMVAMFDDWNHLEPKDIHTGTVLASVFSVLSPFSAFSPFVSAIPEADRFRQPPGGGSKLTPASSEVVLTLEKSTAHTSLHVVTVMTVKDHAKINAYNKFSRTSTKPNPTKIGITIETLDQNVTFSKKSE